MSDPEHGQGQQGDLDEPEQVEAPHERATGGARHLREHGTTMRPWSASRVSFCFDLTKAAVARPLTETRAKRNAR
jgi:hypothetical protein